MKKALLFLFLFQFLILSSVFAQPPEIENGLIYLTTVQNRDGSWGSDESGAELLPSTVSVIETLQILNAISSYGYADARSWLQLQGLDTTDYHSERIHALSVVGADADLLISYMDATLHAWGGMTIMKSTTSIRHCPFSPSRRSIIKTKPPSIMP